MKKRNNLLFLILLFLGTYFPTSINGEINSGLMYLKLILFILIASFLIIKQKSINNFTVISLMFILIILITSTLLSPAKEYAFGSLAFIMGFYMMIFVKFENLKMEKIPEKFFLFFNFVTLFIGFSITTGNLFIGNFIINLFSNHKSFLVSSMIERNKPVITFGSHSIAALFIFCLFYMNYKFFQTDHKKLNLLFSMMYLTLLFFLQSNSGFLFLFLGMLLLSTQVLFKMKKIKIIFFIFATFLLIILFGNTTFPFIQESYAQIHYNITSPVNGVLGRFGEESGVLKINLNYIANNIFRPIGFSYQPGLIYTDSGLIEFVLRGSIFLPLIIYFTFFTFLKRNLISKKSAYLIFTIFIITDAIIYPIIKFTTTFYLISAMIIFLNTLEYQKNKRGD